MENHLVTQTLIAAVPGWEILSLESTTSTNDAARVIAQKGLVRPTAVIAEVQTAGRGRRGSAWVSPAGRNVIISVLMRPNPELPPECWTRLTLAAALACCDMLDNIPGLSVTASIKWPNDVYLSGKKVAGILVESVWGTDGGYVIIGTGININLAPTEFPPELQETATSVWIERGGLLTDRNGIIIHYLKALETRVAQSINQFDGMLKEAWQRSELAHRKVTLTSARVALEGTVIGLGKEGELLLQEEGGHVTTISSADMVRPSEKSIG